jgi:hypothetical protein
MPDVYFNPGLSGLGSVGIIQSGQPTQYQSIPQGVGSGGGANLVDSAIAARQNWENRRNSLINQLPYANRRQVAGIHAELQAMSFDERERQQQAHERRMLAHQSLQEGLAMAKVDRETDIDEHGAALVQALPRLRGMLRNGQISKEEYDSSVLDAIGKYGTLGMHHPGAATLVNHYLEEADKQNAFQQRRGISEATKISAKYGIEPAVDPTTGEISPELTRQAAMGTDKYLEEELKANYGTHLSLANIRDPIGVAVGKLDPKTHKFQGDEKGNVVEIDTGRTTAQGAPIMSYIHKNDYLKYGGQLAPESMGAAQPAADPRAELAQRALNDPNASEEHKAAAKRILGIQ